MSKLFPSHFADIVKAVATFLSSIAAAIASFATIVTLTALFGGNHIVNIQNDEGITLLGFVISSLLTSLFILGLSCFILYSFSKVSTNGLN